MATKPTRRAPDPAQATNKKILADRQERIDAKMQAVPDLGLHLDKEPATAAEFLDDAFDKKAYGEPAKTVTRWVYGPDQLVDTCPAMMQFVEKHGLEETAQMYYLTILDKEHEAAADDIMRRGLAAAIRRFGKEKVAGAARDRILKIPSRQVEYEINGEEFGDPLLMGGNVLRDCVERWGNEPGFNYRFLSQRCIDVLGMRGYVFVMSDKGEPVKAGTLMLAKIPTAIALGRARHYAEQSRQLVRDAEDEYLAKTEQLLLQAGAVGAGSRPLKSNEVIRGNASEAESLVDRDLSMGIKFGNEA